MLRRWVFKMWDRGQAFSHRIPIGCDNIGAFYIE